MECDTGETRTGRCLTSRALWCLALAAVLALTHVAAPAGAQQGGGSVLAELRRSAKLHAPDDVLADFERGASETAVIVLLRPTVQATGAALPLPGSAQIPDESSAVGAGAAYSLQDAPVRNRLRAAVAEKVGRDIDDLGAPGIAVERRFSYQFGFSARVTASALQRILGSPEVIGVEKDVVLHMHLAQGLALMNAEAARGTYGGAGVSIAICDSGIDTSHPRLGGTAGFPNAKVIGGYDTGDNDADPRPGIYAEAHGTCSAGIAAGSLGTVGSYIGGVAPEARLYAIKISSGPGGDATSSAMIAGWEWCVTHQNDDPANPILIISTSYGGGKYSGPCDAASPAMTAAAANAVAAGITLFASSGNDGYCDSMAWPACISHVNSVGAVYDAGVGTSFPCVDAASCAVKTAGACATGFFATDSTRPDKVASYSNSAPFLTLLAPANLASTADIVGIGGYSPGDYFTGFGGTSAASPYAAGAAAVLQSAAKARSGSYLTPDQVRTALVDYGDSVTDGKVAITRPRINLGRAVDALAFTSLTVASTNPTSGVPIAVSPVDIGALGDGTTPFARAYGNGVTVTLTAPATAAGNAFSGWIGCSSASGLTCSVTLDAGRTVRAYYRAATVAHPAANDFDGDGRSDIGCYFPPAGAWYGYNSSEGFWQTRFGYAGTIPVTGTFDGDGRSDIGCYFPEGGNWYLFKSAEGFWQTQFGFAGTIPVVGDFDGDGTSDLGCYFPEGGNWYLFRSADGFWQTQFGYAGTIPVAGDFDGDGRDDIGVYHPDSGNWYLFKSAEGFWQTQFGYAGTIPVVGDFDGDGRDDIGVYHPPSGSWQLLKSAEGSWQTQFGYPGTEPVVGDFDGDGRDDIGVYSAPGGAWYVFKSTEGFWQTAFGYAGTIPLGGTLR